MARDPDFTGGVPRVDPFADLLFALVAAILPALVVLPARLPEPVVTLDGERAAAIIAEPNGLRLTWMGNRHVGLDDVPDDAGLRAALAALRDARTPLLVLIEPAALEAAFLLEPVAAAYGPARIAQVRVITPCKAVRQPLFVAACGR